MESYFWLNYPVSTQTVLMEWGETRTRPLLLRLSTPFKCLTDMCCCAMEYIVLAVVNLVVVIKISIWRKFRGLNSVGVVVRRTSDNLKSSGNNMSELLMRQTKSNSGTSSSNAQTLT